MGLGGSNCRSGTTMRPRGLGCSRKYTDWQRSSWSCRTRRVCSTTRPATMALVVAIAGIILPAIAVTYKIILLMKKALLTSYAGFVRYRIRQKQRLNIMQGINIIIWKCYLQVNYTFSLSTFHVDPITIIPFRKFELIKLKLSQFQIF